MAAIHRFAVLVVIAGVFCLPAGAIGQTSCEAPPGTSAIDQYCETIPRADGPRGAGDPGATRTPRPLPASTLRALRGGDADARALADTLAGPAGEGSDGDGGGQGRSNAPKVAGLDAPSAEDPSTNPFSALKASVGSGGSIGGGFIWTLIAIALLMFSLAWLRFRRAETSD